MGFQFDFYYPTKENPDFTVMAIENGYKFTITNGEVFSIDSHTVNMLNAATGYEGEKAEAIEHFRDFIRGFRQ